MAFKVSRDWKGEDDDSGRDDWRGSDSWDDDEHSRDSGGRGDSGRDSDDDEYDNEDEDEDEDGNGDHRDNDDEGHSANSHSHSPDSASSGAAATITSSQPAITSTKVAAVSTASLPTSAAASAATPAAAPPLNSGDDSHSASHAVELGAGISLSLLALGALIFGVIWCRNKKRHWTGSWTFSDRANNGSYGRMSETSFISSGVVANETPTTEISMSPTLPDSLVDSPLAAGLPRRSTMTTLKSPLTLRKSVTETVASDYSNADSLPDPRLSDGSLQFGPFMFATPPATPNDGRTGAGRAR
ncbi:hypothetical protein MNV49_005494 [Pseudohyphozyma bogoriensis]|nr:hypothetical protein MNV49_005494 [Pseudohyphozyma bogoriensis]